MIALGTVVWQGRPRPTDPDETICRATAADEVVLVNIVGEIDPEAIGLLRGLAGFAGDDLDEETREVLRGLRRIEVASYVALESIAAEAPDDFVTAFLPFSRATGAPFPFPKRRYQIRSDNKRLL